MLKKRSIVKHSQESGHPHPENRFPWLHIVQVVKLYHNLTIFPISICISKSTKTTELVQRPIDLGQGRCSK